MSHQAKVKTAAAYPLPEHVRAWVLGDPGQLSLVDKPIPGAVLVPRRFAPLTLRHSHAVFAPEPVDLVVVGSIF